MLFTQQHDLETLRDSFVNRPCQRGIIDAGVDYEPIPETSLMTQ